MKKVLWLGILAGLVMLIANMIVSYIFGAIVPGISAEYLNINIFRAFSDPLMSLYFVHPFLLGIILAWVWNKVKSAIPGFSPDKRGLKFGSCVFLIATIPGMFMSYGSFQLSFAIILSWTVSSFVVLILAGMLYAKLNP